MSAPLQVARLVSLALATAFGIIGMSVGVDALVQSDRQKNTVRQSAPAGVSVSIDTSDVFASGVVNTVVCALLAVVSSSALTTALVSAPARRASRLCAHVLLLLSVWLFAALVPFTDSVAHRQANVSATLDGAALPPSVIQAVQAQSGATGTYHAISYREWPPQPLHRPFTAYTPF
ncbi:hypothetical protein SCP_0600060 [Sparassis crispa]|uniref:Uncharacterized protein n=1 Tax=Sparassis crispa TaxID=139825 RepID=A0A401GPF2_9APHY|nr:hypothetical protein SCP_0600060 [Sparassis crispa]GBE84029.1 hypothetical protein SCP_0600060 [Sparassis crispa]